MGAAKGNQNAKGNPGGGRPSAYQEKANAELLHEIFFGTMSKEEIMAKIQSGKHSIKDAFIAKALAGDRRVQIEIFKKLFPDLRVDEKKGEVTIKLVDFEGAEPNETDK